MTACTSTQQAPVLVGSPGRTGVVMPIENPSLQEATERAVADLSRRLSISGSTVRIVSADAVDWPSSALGCPQPDRMYMTVLTPGYRIVLEADGAEYHYHAGRQGEPFLCPADRNQGPARSPASR
jgi:hypothetical protein